MKKILVMGNGPSINTFDLRLEDYDFIIGVNRIFKKIKKINMYVALDKRCWTDFLPEIIGLQSEFYITSEKYVNIFTTSQLPLLGLKFTGEENSLKGLGHGYSSIYPALTLALFFFPKHIDIIGVDFVPGNTTHFYGNRNISLSRFSLMQKCFINLINVSKNLCSIHIFTINSLLEKIINKGITNE